MLRRARKNVGFVCAHSATGGGDGDDAVTEKRRETNQTIVGGRGDCGGIGFPNIEKAVFA